MSPRGSPVPWLAIVCACAATPLSATAQYGPDISSDASPDAVIEQYLADRGLTELLAAQLRDRLAHASDRSRPAIAERLGSLYVQMLDAADTAPQRRRMELLGRELLDQVPEADSYDLRVNLAKASYLHAESSAERYRLRLAAEQDREESEATLRAILPTLTGIGVRVNAAVERLERQESRGTDPDEDGLKDRLAAARRIRSLAMYYAGWSNYYLALLTGHNQHATEALKQFGWLLNSPNGRTASVDRVSGGLLKYEHVSRAAIGSALCESIRGNDDSALRWLDLIAQATDVPDSVRTQILGRRIEVLASAHRWADLEFLLSRRRKAAEGPLTAGEARLLAVRTLEALGRDDLNARARPLVEGLARAGMGDLVARGEVGQVLDLVDRYGSAQMGTEGFIVNYVRGLQAYESARTAQSDAGESPDEPTAADAIANQYRAAAALLDASLHTSDADVYASERTNAAIVRGLALFHAGDFEAASRTLEQAHQSAATSQQADEALWLALVALDRAVDAGSAALEPDRDRLVTLYLHSYPAGERAARLILRRGSDAPVSDEQTVSTLLGIPTDSPLYATSRRQAARLLYKAYRAAAPATRDFAAMRFLGIAEPILALDRDRALAGGPDAQPAGESAIVLARQVLDASLAISTADLVRAAAAIDTLDRLARQGGFSLNDLDGELEFRRFQIALARGDRSTIDSSLATLRQAGGKHADAADRLLYRQALQAWTNSPQDPARAVAFVEIGRRVLAQFAPGPDALSDPAVAGAFDSVARAALVVWRAQADASMRELALESSRRLLEANHKTRDVLRRIAELSESAGQPAEALDAWRQLLAALPPDSPDWFEAWYQSLRLLAAADPSAAAEVMQQFRVLYPDYGPEPWRTRIKALEPAIFGNKSGGNGS